MSYSCGNLRASALFTSPILKTCHWINLYRLALFYVDGHLITYIIQHCPNLFEFCIDSPLALPICNSFKDLIPMKKLEILYIAGFYKLAIENENAFVRLFPNVTTLNLSLNKNTLSEEALAHSCYIPRLFSLVTFTILSSSEVQLSKLINECKYE
jgi:hypothetical protein